MREKYTNNGCGYCKQKGFAHTRQNGAALFGNFLLILLPKCPFCLLAYSSTLVLCSKEETVVASASHASAFTIGITALLCTIILATILFRYRDRRTLFALAFAGTGMALMLTSAAWGGGELLYYCGTVFIFAGIWINGSYFSFRKQLRNRIKTLQVYLYSRFPGAWHGNV